MTNEEYISIVKDGAFVALSPESVAGIRLRLTRAAMQASFPPEHEELDLTKCEGKAIMIRGHGGGGEWIWSTEVVDVAGPTLTETVRKFFAVTITRSVNARSALGTNITDISDWSLERSFVDSFKTTARSISSSTILTATSGWAGSITVFSQPGEIAVAGFSFISTTADSMTKLVCGMHLSI